MTRFWSSSVSRPDDSSTRWMTNITSGRPASYSSNTSAILFCTAQGRMPSRNSVICLPSLRTIASLPTRSIRLTWLSRLTRTQRPVEARRDLLDMGRFAGAVIALHHDAAVEGKAGEDRERRVRCRTDSPDRCPAHARCYRIGRHHHLGVEAEFLLHRHRRVGQVGDVAIDLVHISQRLHGRNVPFRRQSILFGGGLRAFSNLMKVGKRHKP